LIFYSIAKAPENLVPMARLFSSFLHLVKDGLKPLLFLAIASPISLAQELLRPIEMLHGSARQALLRSRDPRGWSHLPRLSRRHGRHSTAENALQGQLQILPKAI
jgi:hypothetical protein